MLLSRRSWLYRGPFEVRGLRLTEKHGARRTRARSGYGRAVSAAEPGSPSGEERGNPAGPEVVSRLEQAVERLVRQVGHWEARRWSAVTPVTVSPGVTSPGGKPPATTASGATASGIAASGGGGVAGGAESHADRVYALVQWLADTAARAEGEARRVVPRLTDQVLPDQLRVMADDLIAAGAPDGIVTQATDTIEALRRTL